MARPGSRGAGGDLYLVLVGDIEINREEPGEVFDHVLPVLREAGLRFGGLESSLSDKGTPLMGKIVMRHSPRMIEGYLAAGFDVLAFGTNHCLDYGIEPFVETLDLLDRRGILHSGAGRNAAEARRPAIAERNGVRVGFLTYLLEYPMGWWALPEKPGVVPIRQDPLVGPPYVNQEDLEAMVADVQRTRPLVDVLVVTGHWGSSQSRTVTLSQRAVAHAAIDAGADLVIGSHPHILQGVEVYKGKGIFYALGNFVLDHAHPMFAPTVKESILVKCFIEGGKIARLSFVPVLIGPDGKPRILEEGEERCREILATMEKLAGKLDTRLRVSGNEASVGL
ncbi:MAG: CapA family protein [Nitrospinota bacterium]